MKELIQLERLAKLGKITRREFLAGLSALGFTAAFSSSLIADSGTRFGT